jgi:hypothetical protein
MLRIFFSVDFWKNLLLSLLQAFRDTLYEIGDGLADLFSGKDIGKGLEESLSNSLKNIDIGKSLTGVGDQLFGVLEVAIGAKGLDAADRIGKAIKDATQKGVSLLERAWNAMKQAFAWVYNTFLAPWVELFKIGFNFVYDTFLAPFVDLLKIGWKFIYDTVLSPFIDAIRLVWDFIKVTIIDPFVSSFYAIGDFFAKLFDDPVAAIRGLLDDSARILNNLIEGLGNWIGKAGESVGKWGEQMWDGLKTAAVASWVWISSLGANIWQGLKNAVSGLLEWGKSIWTGFAGSVGDWASNLGKKIWEGFRSSVTNLGNIFSFSSGGKVTSNFGGPLEQLNWSNYGSGISLAKGGQVPLYAAGGTFVPKGTDTVPAMLTPGEFVINRGAVASLGLPLMERLNRGQGPATNQSVVINLNIKTEQPIDESFVRSKLMPAVRDELRRASLDGRRILAPQGVR